MSLARQEKHIAEAVATIRRFGAQLVAQGSYGVDHHHKTGWELSREDKAVCICGAIALTDNPRGSDIISAVARKLGITIIQAASLSDGFEDRQGYTLGRDYEVDRMWFRIGRKWRQRADEVRN